MKEVLEAAWRQGCDAVSEGRVADYIPALASMPSHYLAACIHPVHGDPVTVGDAEVPFSLQSISKIFSLTRVLNVRGVDAVLRTVGMEPSGNPFYSLVQLEYENGKPRNPLINAGAIALTALLPGATGEQKCADLLEFLRSLTGGDGLRMNEAVYRSEADTSHRNRAVGHFMKHFGLIEGDVAEAVDGYFRQCSIEVDCRTLARMGLFLANHGVDPVAGTTVAEPESARFVNAEMMMCGLYDASGEFACRVGLPAKSGVGGGILAVVPGRMTIAVFGPALDAKGNSAGGLRLLEHFSNALNLSLFA